MAYTKEKMKQYHAERYRRLRREGLCVACGHRFAEKGRVRCVECLEKNLLCGKRRKMMASQRLREALGNGRA